MNGKLFGTAAAVLLLSSMSAFAATTTPAASTPASAPAAATHATQKVDYAARCTSLSDQWKTAEAANASNKKLGKAKALEAKGEKQCGSTKMADQKRGVKSYTSALKLLGVKPT